MKKQVLFSLTMYVKSWVRSDWLIIRRDLPLFSDLTIIIDSNLKPTFLGRTTPLIVHYYILIKTTTFQHYLLMKVTVTMEFGEIGMKHLFAIIPSGDRSTFNLRKEHAVEISKVIIHYL